MKTFSGLLAGFALALGLPSAACAVAPSLTGPASVDEDAGTATYTVACGDSPNPLSPPAPLPPLAPVINTGALAATVEDGPAPATEPTEHGPPLPPAVPCGVTPTVDVVVAINDDTTDEQDEKFTLTVSGTLAPPPPAAAIEFKQSVTTTVKDDDVPTAAIQSRVQVTEGDSGTANASLVVTLSQAPAKDVTISFTTENGSAAAGSDFTATSGDLKIRAGQKTGTITVPVIGDQAAEGAESFFVRLTDAQNAAIEASKSRGEVAISDNDKPGTGGGGGGGGSRSFSIAGAVSVREGRRGTVTAAFPVKLSSASSDRTQVDWRTASGTAGTSDFNARNGTLVFEPGDTTETVTVAVRSDTRDEPNETFTVVLERPVGASIASREGKATILDDDGPKVSIGRPKASRRALVTKLGCPRSADRCKGRVVATAPGLKLGAARFTLGAGAGRAVEIRLTRRGRAALRRRGLRVKLKVTAADRSGAKRVTTRRFRVARVR